MTDDKQAIPVPDLQDALARITRTPVGARAIAETYHKEIAQARSLGWSWGQLAALFGVRKKKTLQNAYYRARAAPPGSARKPLTPEPLVKASKQPKASASSTPFGGNFKLIDLDKE